MARIKKIKTIIWNRTRDAGKLFWLFICFYSGLSFYFFWYYKETDPANFISGILYNRLFSVKEDKYEVNLY